MSARTALIVWVVVWAAFMAYLKLDLPMTEKDWKAIDAQSRGIQ